MRTGADCLLCFARQTLEVLRWLDVGEEEQAAVLQGVMRAAGAMDLSQPPPAMARTLHGLIRAATGRPDPYREVKERLNRFALGLYPRIREKVMAADDPFEAAARMAAAGNIIDLGAKTGLKEEDVEGAIEDASRTRLDAGAVARLRAAAEAAESILYIGDNAGEIVFDRLLVERLGPGKVVFAVRGGPIINDATREDAAASGMDKLAARVIDSGSDAPGTLLGDCSPEFRRVFDTSDLVLAKGQGNYETLHGRCGRGVFFLLRVKCPVVARDIGCPIDTQVLRT